MGTTNKKLDCPTTEPLRYYPVSKISDFIIFEFSLCSADFEVINTELMTGGWGGGIILRRNMTPGHHFTGSIIILLYTFKLYYLRTYYTLQHFITMQWHLICIFYLSNNTNKIKQIKSNQKSLIEINNPWWNLKDLVYFSTWLILIATVCNLLVNNLNIVQNGYWWKS